MASWVRTITSPFRKACTLLNISKDRKKSRQGDESQCCMNLHGEVMACAYEDVQVMWSILDKAKHSPGNMSS
ncbi:hypothetical protein QJS04_geneDACA004712 [Acorus gramineus]|uniref:Uncharacterized protein n=1 Tax=Acorus gramineus TaxID=55184 RepID=A0AAV9BYJ4_ACOGR|nr:hypothetical protein QJS04_geneDACA004712 [Acorus gramineus]